MNTNWSNNYLQVDPTQDFALSWPAFNVGDNGTVFLQIDNTNISHAFNADGTQTGYTIPAGTLQPNQLYQVELSFLSFVGSSSTFGSGTGANFQSTVKFIIQTGTLSPSSNINAIQKKVVLLQTSNSNPVNATMPVGYGDPAPYNVSVQGAMAGSVNGPAGSIALSYQASSNDGDYRFQSPPLATQAAMDAKYPNGTYTLTDGQTVSLTGNIYPTAPKVTLVNGAVPIWNSKGQLKLDPSIANTLTWTAYSGSSFSTNGSEHLEFQSETGDDLDYSKKAGLGGGTTTSFNTATIPANALILGHTYVGSINYLTASSVSSPSANVVDAAGYTSETYFNAIAAPSSGTAQSISFPAIGSIGFTTSTILLNASATSGLPVEFTVSGPATVSGNMLTLTGPGTVMVTASQGGNSTYAPATDVSQNITVRVATQTISFPSVGAQAFGDAPINLTATASSGLTVSFTLVSGPATLSGNTLTLTGAGVVVVRASQSGDADFAAAVSVSQAIAVAKEAQTITFPAIGNQTFPVAPITLSATASSGLTVTYKVSGPATILGSTLTILDAGTVVVEALQAGNTTFAASPTLIQTITVAKGTQTINFTDPANQTFGVAPITLSATATSGLPVAFHLVSGPAVVVGTKAYITGGGTVMIQATQAGSVNYAAATPVTQSFSVAQEAQTITFPAIANRTYGAPAFVLVSTASSKLAVSFSVVSGPATIVGKVLTITGGGSIMIQASQAGNANYLAASNVTQSFTVNPAVQVIAVAAVPVKIFGAAPFALTATATSHLPVGFSYISGPATLSGNEVTITGAGTIVIEATQTGNASYQAAAPVMKSIVVEKAAQTIAVGAVTGVVFGASPITLSATATSGLSVTFTYISGPGSLSGNMLTVTGAGTIVVHASQAGDANHLAAVTVAKAIIVAKAAQTITFPTVGSQVFPSSPITLGATASSGLGVIYTSTGPATVSGSTLTLKGVGTVVVKAYQTGSINYLAAPIVAQSITVTP